MILWTRVNGTGGEPVEVDGVIGRDDASADVVVAGKARADSGGSNRSLGEWAGFPPETTLSGR